MSMPSPLMLKINGKPQPAFAELDETLLTVLRDRFQLTGTKRGCNQGVCGACTVLIDDEPVRSCLSLAHLCADREITTIEGAASIAPRLQAAFAEAGAVQCGFCTPGMILAASALLAANPRPSIPEIQAGLSGNLCRCSGYRKIIEAVRLVAEEKAP